MSEVEFRQAVCDALDEELARDESVIFFGEDVAEAGGVFAVTKGLAERHGSRVFDTAISELAITGAAFGAAVTGIRPVIEIMFGDFLLLAMDCLVNQATKYWYISNGQSAVPMTIRSIVGGGARFGPIHSQMPVSWIEGVPGLKIVCPSNPNDAAGLLKAAIRDNNPTLVFEHKRLYSMKGVRATTDPLPLGKAAVLRQGADVTLASAMKGVHDCLAAADLLAERGIAAEVIDLRTLRPFDWETLEASIAKTNRLVVVEEGPVTGGWAGEVLAQALERSLGELDDAWRLATPDTPVPYSPLLEDAFLPDARSIADSVSQRMGAGPVAVVEV
ncbi:MAG: alpha-ketoacid dehydrogenase subunit beta [Actinobacteria bacterium]|nr:alpha-ketoacid dehydrogenase subunit beta [Actinomycetota bacterium]